MHSTILQVGVTEVKEVTEVTAVADMCLVSSFELICYQFFDIPVHIYYPKGYLLSKIRFNYLNN
jgi:hypothetical protein